jgi:hypothetical protein
MNLNRPVKELEFLCLYGDPARAKEGTEKAQSQYSSMHRSPR